MISATSERCHIVDEHFGQFRKPVCVNLFLVLTDTGFACQLLLIPDNQALSITYKKKKHSRSSKSKTKSSNLRRSIVKKAICSHRIF